MGISKTNIREHRNLSFAAIIILLTILPVLSGCLNMTPRSGVPREVNVTITSTGACEGANCTCLTEDRRPRYQWWLCTDGYSTSGYTPAAIYNTTFGDTCKDIRQGGLAARGCLHFNTTKPYYRVKADCTDVVCSNYDFYSVTGDTSRNGECQAICHKHKYDFGLRCSCHGADLKATYSCPSITAGSQCTCASYNGPVGIPPCYGTGPGGTGCEVLIPEWYFPVYGSSVPACVAECDRSFDAEYLCTSGITGVNTLFGTCEPHYESTFQGGGFRTVNPCNASAMQSIIQDPLRDIPFFMIGQGATLEAFMRARNYCTPAHDYTTHLQLGDSVFHPGDITVSNGTQVCWNSEDIAHDLSLDNGAEVLNGTTRVCRDNLTVGLHHMADTQTGEISNITVDANGHIYMSDGNFSPSTLVFKEVSGTTLSIHNLDGSSVAVRVWGNPWGTGAGTPYTIPANGVQSFPIASSPSPYYIIKNEATGVTATVILLTESKMFGIDSSGFVSPPSRLMSVKQGDQVCFTCGTAFGHILTFSKVVNATDTVFYENRTLSGTATCCWNPPPGIFKIKDNLATTNPDAMVYVTDKNTSYNIYLHDYHFNPQILTVKSGTEVCFVNPSGILRRVRIQESGAIYTIPSKGLTCGYKPAVGTWHVLDDFTKSNATLFVYSLDTVFVNVSSLGLQPRFVRGYFGGQVCFTNKDTVKHDVYSHGSSDACPVGAVAPPSLLMSLAPGDVSCLSTPGSGAFRFNESSSRRDPSTGNLSFSNSSATVLVDRQSNFTFYILPEPTLNGSIQPNSIFLLTNDTLKWVNCFPDDHELVTNRQVSNDPGLPMSVPAGGYVYWQNLTIGSTEIKDYTNPDFNLTARLFTADANSFSNKNQYIYTGPATVNNKTTHLAVVWMPGDVGTYTLRLTRQILNERAFPAFITGLRTNVLVTLYPRTLVQDAVSIPSGSNMTWINGDMIAHTVRRSWCGGNFILAAFPGNVSYRQPPCSALNPPTSIPSGNYNVREPSTGLNYPITVYDRNWVINMSMLGYSPSSLTTHNNTVCFVNRGTTERNLTITPPAVAGSVYDAATPISLAEGNYTVYAYNSVTLAKGCPHLLKVGEAGSIDLSVHSLCANGTEYLLETTMGTARFGSDTLTQVQVNYTTDTTGCASPDCCYDRNFSLDGASDITLHPPFEFVYWTPDPFYNPRHTIAFKYREPSNTTILNAEILYGSPIDFSEPAGSHSEVFVESGSTATWTNPASCVAGMDKIFIEMNLPPTDITLDPNGGTICYDLLSDGAYTVVDNTIPSLGTMTITAVAPRTPGMVDYIELAKFGDDLSFLETTPRSNIRWRSTDGRTYNLSTMQGTRIVTPSTPYDWNPVGLIGTFAINETTTGKSWSVTSNAGNFFTEMFTDTSIFNPPSAIIRSNTAVCFRNNDTVAHTIRLCRYLPNYTMGSAPCGEFCSYSFGSIQHDWHWAYYENSPGGGWPFHGQTYTFTIQPPALTSAWVSGVLYDLGNVMVNGIPASRTSDSTDPGCDCEVNPGCSPVCNDWLPPKDVAQYLHVGTNTITIAVANFSRSGYGWDVWINGDRDYSAYGWSANNIPPTPNAGSTRCIDPATIGNPNHPACPPPPPPPYNFTDSVTGNMFNLRVTDVCYGNESDALATKLNDYDNPAFDNYQYNIINSFNAHGPAWPSIVTSEVDQPDTDCVCRQTRNITRICANCTTALAVGYPTSSGGANWRTFSDAVLGSCSQNVDVVALFVDGNALASSIPSLCDGSCNCNFTAIWENLAQASKYLLYKYKKPTVVLSFKMTPGVTTCFDDNKISRMYDEFYSTPISHLSGAGLFGIAYACLDATYPSGDCITSFNPAGMGLSPSPPTADEFKKWFGRCGNYYQNSEGLTMLTFSANETNSTACDSSRIMDLYQQYKCYAG